MSCNWPGTLWMHMGAIAAFGNTLNAWRTADALLMLATVAGLAWFFRAAFNSADGHRRHHLLPDLVLCGRMANRATRLRSHPSSALGGRLPLESLDERSIALADCHGTVHRVCLPDQAAVLSRPPVLVLHGSLMKKSLPADSTSSVCASGGRDTDDGSCDARGPDCRRGT